MLRLDDSTKSSTLTDLEAWAEENKFNGNACFQFDFAVNTWPDFDITGEYVGSTFAGIDLSVNVYEITKRTPKGFWYTNKYSESVFSCLTWKRQRVHLTVSAALEEAIRRKGWKIAFAKQRLAREQIALDYMRDLAQGSKAPTRFINYGPFRFGYRSYPEDRHA